MNSHPFLTLAIAIALCSISGIPCARAAEEKPTLTEPDKSVVLPENLKKDAEACFAKGYTYFIWPAATGPFRRGDSIIVTVPFNYIAKGKPEPYKIAFTILAKKEGTEKLDGRTQILTSRKYTYSSAGKSDAFHLDALKQFSSGKASATIHLLDYSTGQKQVSNMFTVDIEL